MAEKRKLDPATEAWFKQQPKWTRVSLLKCEKCGCYYKDSLGHTCEELKMYVEYRDGKPCGYLYGPSWKAMELYMEGGFETPEEAKAAWEAEQRSKK